MTTGFFIKKLKKRTATGAPSSHRIGSKQIKNDAVFLLTPCTSCMPKSPSAPAGGFNRIESVFRFRCVHRDVGKQLFGGKRDTAGAIPLGDFASLYTAVHFSLLKIPNRALIIPPRNFGSLMV